MAVARRLTSLGRAARAEAGVKVRQPLARALVFLPTNAPHPPAGVVEEELNVDHLEYGQELAEVLSFELVPNFRSVGPRLGEAVKELRGALSALDAGEAGRALEAGEGVTVTLSSGSFELRGEDLELRVKGQGGFAVSREGGEVVALDLTLDDDLRRRGYLRDVVRQVQDLRKTSGLDVSDRIVLHVTGLDDLAEWFDILASEVLARDVVSDSRCGRGDRAGLRRRANGVRLGRQDLARRVQLGEESREDASLAVVEASREVVVQVAKVHEERFVQLGASLVGDRDPDGAPVIGAVFAPDVARLLETVNEAGRATRRVNDGVGDLVHLEPTVVTLAQLQKHVEPGEG